MYIYDDYTATLANCVFWDNIDDGGTDESAQINTNTGSVTIDYSCVQGWTGTLGGTGNIGNYPQFVDPDGPDNIYGTSDDNPRLSLSSPCVDAGDNSAVPPPVTIDLDGVPRFIDNLLVPDTGFGAPPVVDMGPYEYSIDCNGNGVPDDQDIDDGISDDCNEDNVPDECEATGDCNENGVCDHEDIANGTSQDCTSNGIPDECEPDCNGNGAADSCDLADGTSKDCNENEVPDECDLAEGTSEDLNGNSVPDECDAQTPWPEDSFGMSCENDDQCEGATTCIHGVCYAPKNRYISITLNPENGSKITARRVSLETNGLEAVVVGWVGEPTYNPIEGILTAVISDLPVYNVIDFLGGWPSVIHVTGCHIAPGETYLIQAIVTEQAIDDESNYFDPLALPTSPVWGDVVSACPHGVCSPPEGDPFTQPNIDDVLALVNAFQGVDNAPLTWLDIDPVAGDGYPEGMVVIGDVLAVVLAFQGEPYPGNGPLGCP